MRTTTRDESVRVQIRSRYFRAWNVVVINGFNVECRFFRQEASDVVNGKVSAAEHDDFGRRRIEPEHVPGLEFKRRIYRNIR